MKKRTGKIATATFALGLIIPQVLPTISYADVVNKDVVKLRIMETTDIHSHVTNYDYFSGKNDETFGLAKTASLIKKAKEESKNNLLFDNGDLIQGNPMADYVFNQKVLDNGQKHPVYEAMNLLGYDVGNLGNHEFNYGLDFLKKATSGAEFPYVNANAYQYDGDDDPTNDKNYFTPYVILDKEVVDEDGEKHTIKVGVIGFVPPQITQWDKNNLEGKVITHDIKETAEKFVPKMKEEGADLIVAIAHSGIGLPKYENLAENQTYQLSTVKGIDAILFGHTHTTFPGKDYASIEKVDNVKGTINGIPAVQPGFWGSHLGIVDLEIEKVDGKWAVKDSQSEVRAIYDSAAKKPLVDADKEVLDAVHEHHEGTIKYVNAPVGKTASDLYSFFSQVQDDPTIQIVNDAQKKYIEKYIQGTEYEGLPVLSAGAPFKAGRDGATDFTNIPTGDLAIKDTTSLYKYANTVMALKLTGEQIIEWLEWSAGQFNQIDPTKKEEQVLVKDNKSDAPGFPSYNYDVIDGIEYQIDVTQPQRYDNAGKKISDSHRIVNVKFNGEPIDLKKEFIVATNNYRATFTPVANPGGDKIIIESPDENRQVLVNYIREGGTVNPKADMNWSFAPINGDVNLVFKSSPEGKKYAEQTDNITYIETLEDGFAKFKIDLSKGEKPSTSKSKFADVHEGHWAYSYIVELEGLGILKGKSSSSFDPDGKLTRGQFISLIARGLELKSKSAHPFKDVPGYLSSEVSAAYEAGILIGYETKLDPNQSINREEMANLLLHAYKVKTGEEYKLSELGLVSEDKLTDQATRAEAAKVISVLVKK